MSDFLVSKLFLGSEGVAEVKVWCQKVMEIFNPTMLAEQTMLVRASLTENLGSGLHDVCDHRHQQRHGSRHESHGADHECED